MGIPLEATPAIQVLGRPQDPSSYRIRDFLTRSAVAYEWVEIDDARSRAELGVGLADARLPGVRVEGVDLVQPSPEEIAARRGWTARPQRRTYDLAIFGAGPAGLSTAVYAASEGLSTIVVERGAVGGQAGSSSLIENHLGFPHGIAGDELADRARRQALDFGAEIAKRVASAVGDGAALASFVHRYLHDLV